MKGFLWGTLVLIALGSVVQTDASTNLSGGLGKANGWLNTFLAPDKPLIRDYRKAAPAASPVSQQYQTLGQEQAANLLRSTAGGGSTAPGAGH